MRCCIVYLRLVFSIAYVCRANMHVYAVHRKRSVWPMLLVAWPDIPRWLRNVLGIGMHIICKHFIGSPMDCAYNYVCEFTHVAICNTLLWIFQRFYFTLKYVSFVILYQG